MPPAPRDRMADPIPAADYPAYIRRSAPSDPTIQRIWDEGMNRSQAMTLGQVFLDQYGQRLTGSPQSDAAQEWLVRTYAGWGVSARRERYGTWLGWNKGVTHLDCEFSWMVHMHTHPERMVFRQHLAQLVVDALWHEDWHT